MKEKSRIVYTTEKPDLFGILEEDEVKTFVKEEVDRMATESKRGKSVRPPTLIARRVRKGRVIVMSPELSNQPAFRVFNAVHNNPGAGKKEISSILGKPESGVGFHLNNLQKMFPGVFIMTRRGVNYEYEVRVPDQLKGLSAEAVYTNLKKPVSRRGTAPTPAPAKQPRPQHEPAVQSPKVTTIPQSVLAMVRSITISITDQGVSISLDFKE